MRTQPCAYNKIRLSAPSLVFYESNPYTLGRFTTELFFTIKFQHGKNMNIELSARESEILAHIKLGKTNKDIANSLNIAVGTVKLHVNSIFRKLGVKNRVQAVYVSSANSENNSSA